MKNKILRSVILNDQGKLNMGLIFHRWKTWLPYQSMTLKKSCHLHSQLPKLNTGTGTMEQNFKTKKSCFASKGMTDLRTKYL